MSVVLNPYLSFSDNAAQAMAFYQEVLGGELIINTFGEFGAEGPDADKVMHAGLRTENGITLMGADTPAGMEWSTGKNGVVSLSGDDIDLLHGCWAKLTDGGTIDVPLEQQAWGDEYGQCTDKFGISWMFNIAVEQA